MQVTYLRELDSPDVTVTFFMNRMLIETEEEYIRRVIISWYDVGAHSGFGADGAFHCLNDIIFDNEQTIFIDADLGGAPNEALDALFTVVVDAMSGFKVTVKKIEVS